RTRCGGRCGGRRDRLCWATGTTRRTDAGDRQAPTADTLHGDHRGGPPDRRRYRRPFADGAGRNPLRPDRSRARHTLFSLAPLALAPDPALPMTGRTMAQTTTTDRTRNFTFCTNVATQAGEDPAGSAWALRRMML